MSWEPVSRENLDKATIFNPEGDPLHPSHPPVLRTRSLLPSRSGISGSPISVVVISGPIGVAVIVTACSLSQPPAALGTSERPSCTFMQNPDLPSELE